MGSNNIALRDMPHDTHKHKSTFQDGRDEEVVCRMHEVSFKAMSDADIFKNSVAIIDRPDLYSRGDPAHNGPLDTRMGVNLRTLQCAICGGSCNGCGGHFGHTETVQPLFNYGYFHFVKAILNIVCLVCYRIPLNEREKKAVVQRILRHQMRNELDLQRRKLLLASLVKKVSKIKVCPLCGAAVAPVRMEGMYFFIVEQLLPNRDLNEVDKPVKTKLYWDANRVRNILQWISHEDQILMMMDPRSCRPESLISQVLPISPVTIRPSVSHGAQMSFTEDDISIFFAQVVGMDKYIRRHLSTMIPNSFIDYWEQLQYRWYKLVNANVKPPKGLDLHGPGSKTVRASKGFEQRLKGKMGRFRGNLSGKRVNYSSRTVISPDPNLRIDQVGVPAFVARKLTFPERVTSMNIEIMKQMVLNGPDIYPGAHSVTTQHGRMKKLYISKIRPAVSESLRIGDIVHRHVLDGDIVLFNRQPSLHKLSIMAHRVKVLNNRTFRFNECVCAPYNADFDGDEMNLHMLQTYQAKAEAESLMATTQNLQTPKNGEILIAATQDFITGSYLITRKDRFYTRDEFYMFLGQVLQQKRASNTQMLPIGSIGVEALTKLLPKPAIWKPIPLWSGKQLMSVVLAPEFDARRAEVNLFNKSRNYTHKGEEMCPADGFLAMRRGNILAGTLDKALVGTGKTNIFFRLMMDFGAEYAADAMFNLARTSIFHLMTRGFSIGITDVQPASILTAQKETLVESGYQRCDEFIRAFTEGNLPCEPGLTPEETLEAKILKELSLIRETAGKACLNELSRNNAPLIMALSGSKGSTINISQMVACVGQQAINGKRVGNGFDNRTLPLFKDYSRDPRSKGFVANSFFTGLEPYEFIFHTMAGREGLVDTAVKTAETGYMYRRLMKALEDLVCKYDNTVRNAAHDILQLKFGDDGLDPREMEGDGEPLEFKHFMYDMNCIMPNGTAVARSKIPNSADELLMPKKAARRRTKTVASVTKNSFGDTMNASNVMQTVLDRASALGTREVNRLAQLLETATPVEAKKLTLPQWQHVCAASNTKCIRSRIEPGTAAGALSAQSIGEPGTQMTLKTFHFAGVATMNITLGVPRIKEIINAVRNISTPIVTTRLSVPNSEVAARIVKARLERTKLSEITRAMAETYERQNFYLELTPNASRIHLLRLECSIESLARAIGENDAMRKLGVKTEVSQRGDKLLLTPPDSDVMPASAGKSKKARAHYDQVSHRIKQIRETVGDVIVAGIPSIKHAIIHMDEKLDKNGNQQYVIFAEGFGLKAVLGVHGVDLCKTTSNSCLEIADILGIEAARQSIIYEINYTMQSHGMTVDARHLQLLADLMCHQGIVLGITRHGMAKMRSSSFKLASFEVTLPSIYDAAFFGINDSMTGVTESIISGQACNFGSGLPQVIIRKQPNKLIAARIAERFSTVECDNVQFSASGAHLPSIDQLKHNLALFASPTTTTPATDVVEHIVPRAKKQQQQQKNDISEKKIRKRRDASISESGTNSESSGSSDESDADDGFDAGENDNLAGENRKKVSLFKQARNAAGFAAAAIADAQKNGESVGTIKQSKRCRPFADIDAEDADGLPADLDGDDDAASRGGSHSMYDELSSLLPATMTITNANGSQEASSVSTSKQKRLLRTNGISKALEIAAASTDDEASTTNTATSSNSQQKKRVRFSDDLVASSAAVDAQPSRRASDKRRAPTVAAAAVTMSAESLSVKTVKVPVSRRSGKAQKPVVQVQPIVTEAVAETTVKPRRGRPRKQAG